MLAAPDLDRADVGRPFALHEPKAVEEYFAFGYVPEPRTIFRSALKPCSTSMSTSRDAGVSTPARGRLRRSTGAVMRRASDAHPGQQLEAQLAEGVLQVQVSRPAS